jgi:hypothetical protein
MAASRLALAGLLSTALLSLAGCPTTPETETVSPPYPVAEGIVTTNLSITTLKADGWRVCLDGYAYDLSGRQVSTVLADCTGRFMMLACGDGSDTLQLAAADARSIVVKEGVAFTSDPALLTTSHGVTWYFNEDGGTSGAPGSWGFFPAGAGVNRDPCDADVATSSDQRLCWRTEEGNLMDGYRCGDQVEPGASRTRYVLVHDGDGSPVTPYDTATALTLGTSVSGTIGSGTELDFYTFTVPAGVTQVRVQTFDGAGSLAGCASDYSGQGTDTLLSIYGPGPTLLAEVDDGAVLDGTITFCEDRTLAIPAGQAWVVVSGIRSAVPPDFGWGYTLLVSDATPAPEP